MNYFLIEFESDFTEKIANIISDLLEASYYVSSFGGITDILQDEKISEIIKRSDIPEQIQSQIFVEGYNLGCKRQREQTLHMVLDKLNKNCHLDSYDLRMVVFEMWKAELDNKTR